MGACIMFFKNIKGVFSGAYNNTLSKAKKKTFVKPSNLQNSALARPKPNPRMMKTSMAGLLEIISHEAVVLSRYKDSYGVWTIGVGVTASARASINPNKYTGTITLSQAISMFGKLIRKYEKIVDRALGKTIVEQHEYDALVSLAYNVGSFGPTTRKYIKAGKIPEAINLWRANKENKGLMKRRDREVYLAQTGKYTAKSIPLFFATKSGKVVYSTLQRIPIEDVKDMLQKNSMVA